WILEDVAHNRQRRFVVAKDALVVPGLPKRATKSLSIGKSRLLLRLLHTSTKVTPLRLRNEKQMHVIGHEAAHCWFKLELGGGLMKLRARAIDHCRVGEY